MKKEKITVYLPENLNEKVREFANDTGRTVSGVVKVSLEDKLNLLKNKK